MILEGRVFARLQRFARLPEDLQHDTKQFQTHMERHKHALFQTHHSALVKSVYSVHGKELIDAVVQWLQARDATPTQATATNNGAATPMTSAAPTTGATVPVFKTPDAAAPTAGATAAPASTAVAPTASAHLHVPTEVRKRARKIAEALVLAGVLTPYKDDLKHLNAPSPKHYVHSTELLIPVAQSVTDLETTSVWSVARGAIYATFLKRWAGVLAPLTNGKEAYVVVNDTNRTAYVFESDLAREPIAEFVGNRVDVQFDNSHFDYGVRVTPKGADEKEYELFDAGCPHAQNEFLNVWLSIGANNREASSKHFEGSAPMAHRTANDFGAETTTPKQTCQFCAEKMGRHKSANDYGAAPTSLESRNELGSTAQMPPTSTNEFGASSTTPESTCRNCAEKMGRHHHHDTPTNEFVGGAPTSHKSSCQHCDAPMSHHDHRTSANDFDGQPHAHESMNESRDPSLAHKMMHKMGIEPKAQHHNTPANEYGSETSAHHRHHDTPTNEFAGGAPTSHKSSCQYCDAPTSQHESATNFGASPTAHRSANEPRGDSSSAPKATCQFCAEKMRHNKSASEYETAPTAHHTSRNEYGGAPVMP